MDKKRAERERGSASRGRRLFLLCRTREEFLCWYGNSGSVLSRSHFFPSYGPVGRCKLSVV